MIKSEFFGKTKKGHDVTLYTLENTQGTKAEIITYGCALRSFKINMQTEIRDIVLGFDTIEDYEAQDKYMGAVVGRFANRIGKGKFVLNNKDYTLAINNGPNHLHGGLEGFDKKVWNGEIKGNSLLLSYTSPDGDEGYPGELKITTEYCLNDDNELSILYTATTDNDTVLNITNHSYFNLLGHSSGDILEHSVQIFADKFTENDGDCLPTGVITEVKNTPLDFNSPKKIVSDINSNHPQIINGSGFDHNFIINKNDNGLTVCAKAVSPDNLVTLEVSTTQVGVQFYSGNFLDGIVKGKNAAIYSKHTGFCFETQGFPNSTEFHHFPSPILKKGEVYKQKTIYKVISK